MKFRKNTPKNRNHVRNLTLELVKTLECRLLVPLEGHLIIVDNEGVEHDFGVVQKLKFMGFGVWARWQFHIDKEFQGAHCFVRNEGARIANQPCSVLFVPWAEAQVTLSVTTMSEWGVE